MSKLITHSRIIYRSTLLFGLVIIGFACALFYQKQPMPRHSLSAKTASWLHKKLTQVVGVPIKVFGTPNTRPTLYIANHISWFDIHAIGSIIPVHFLAKAEIGKMPLMGWMASRAGTLYISRGGKNASTEAIHTMATCLKQNQNIILFAEGTTTDGNIKRFHSRLIQSAIDAECDIQPIAIRYPHVTETNHPAAPFIGDMSMGESVINILRTNTLHAEIHFLDIISSEGKTRDELAREAERQVRGVVEKD